eukprot:33612-Eustigmatos_ZCMA.PRE.1
MLTSSVFNMKEVEKMVVDRYRSSPGAPPTSLSAWPARSSAPQSDPATYPAGHFTIHPRTSRVISPIRHFLWRVLSATHVMLYAQLAVIQTSPSAYPL